MASATKPTNPQEAVLTASIPPSQIPLFLHNKLHPLLPYSLPLYRRCQFHLQNINSTLEGENYQHQPGQPEVWIALSRPDIIPSTSSDSNDWLTTWLSSPQPPIPSQPNSEVWLATHIDLREPGQTQVWTFGSWEATISPQLLASIDPTTTSQPEPQPQPQPHSQTSTPHTSPSTLTAQDPTQIQTSLARALHNHLRKAHIPYLSATATHQYLTMKAAGKIVSDPYKRSKVLFGTLAQASWWILDDHVVASSTPSSSGDGTIKTDEKETGNPNSRVSRSDWTFLKYLLPLPLPVPVPVSATQDAQVEDESGLEAGKMTDAHLQTVLDRSVIPRTLELLRESVAVGLFPVFSESMVSKPEPVAWGILSKDASVSSLHTEPKYRGRGLAQRVTRELVRLTGTKFNDGLGATGEAKREEDGESGDVEWAHTDVSIDNVASRRVFEKMGGKVGWRVAWVEVDVGEDEV